MVMERLSDTAIEIINDLHTERLEYASEYIPLIDAANCLAAYEDTGLEPEEIERIVDAYGRGYTLRTESAERLEIVREIKADRLRELVQAEQDGRRVVLDEKTALSMYAGARAIENNKRLFGATYVYDVFGKQGGPKEIPYFDAANNLRNIASALAQEGGTNEDSGGL